MSRTRRGARALPAREAYERRHPQHIRREASGLVIWLDREPEVVGAYCNDCSRLRRGFYYVPPDRLDAPDVLHAGWIMKRYRAKYVGAFIQDKLTRWELELLVFLKLIADQHRWETGHDTWVTIDPCGLSGESLI